MPLFAACLDVQKAFDVVRHQSLLDKLYRQGLKGHWWKLKGNPYKNITGCVLWEGELSDSFVTLQGNRQATFPSHDDYRSYIMTNLHNLSNTKLGFYISNNSISTPTCADNMLIITTSAYELHVLLNIITDYANTEHYIIHSEKSMIIPFNTLCRHGSGFSGKDGLPVPTTLHIYKMYGLP